MLIIELVLDKWTNIVVLENYILRPYMKDLYGIFISNLRDRIELFEPRLGSIHVKVLKYVNREISYSHSHINS